jgi:hypothetical protein
VIEFLFDPVMAAVLTFVHLFAQFVVRPPIDLFWKLLSSSTVLASEAQRRLTHVARVIQDRSGSLRLKHVLILSFLASACIMYVNRGYIKGKRSFEMGLGKVRHRL